MRNDGGPGSRKNSRATTSSRSASSVSMTRRSTRPYMQSWRRRWSESPRRPSSMRSANTNQGCWPFSKDSFESSTSVLLKIFAALEDLLDLVVDLVEAEGDLGGHGMNAAVHADRLHALQELHVQEGLRRRAVREQSFVQRERVQGPLHDPLELLFGEKVRLTQDVDEGETMPELHRRAKQDGGDEPGSRFHQRGVVQIHEGRVLPTEGIDQDRPGGTEREQFDLTRRVDQDVARLERLEDLRKLPGVHRDHVRGRDLRAVRPEVLFLHDLREVHVVPDVEVGRILEGLGARIQVHRYAVEALRVHPQLEGVHHRRFARSGRPEEVQVPSHGCLAYVPAPHEVRGSGGPRTLPSSLHKIIGGGRRTKVETARRTCGGHGHRAEVQSIQP